MRLQWAIDQSFIELLTGKEVKQSVIIHEFPRGRRSNNQNLVDMKVIKASFIFFAIYVGLIPSFYVFMGRLIVEKATGVQELMKIAGVSTKALLMSHILNALFPGLVFSIGGTVLMKLESGLSFSNMFDAHTPYSGSALLGFIIQIIHIALFFLISWYLEQKAYWRKASVDPMDELETEAVRIQEPQYFEPPPSNLESGIKIVNVTKMYGPNRVVDDLSLEVYKGEITILLGHNGAGKSTLMSIITGVLKPTKGQVLVNGYNIESHAMEARQQIGMCPQQNLFLDGVSVIEHVMFFTLLKKGTYREARISAEKLLEKLNLQQKANSQSSDLSGGMKRRLQLACALAGQANVLILDEPTSGLDVETRRSLWDIFMSLRGSHTVLLSTHFMEEADALGDRVAALHAGQLRCHATPMYLKRAIGTGYRLTFTTTGSPKEAAITSVVQSVVPEATATGSGFNSISYKIPMASTKSLPGLFSKLESKKTELGIESMGVGVSTLEEVFLKPLLNHRILYKVNNDSRMRLLSDLYPRVTFENVSDLEEGKDTKGTRALADCTNTAYVNALCKLNKDKCPFTDVLSPHFKDGKCCGVHSFLMDKILNIPLKAPPQQFDEKTVKAEEVYVKNTIVLPPKEITDMMLVSNVHKNYVDLCTNFYAVKGISFSVKKGECFGLLGVNGAGKTSMFRMLTADRCVTKGQIFANGRFLTLPCFDKYLFSLSYCPQFWGLDDFLTGRQNLDLLLTLQGFNERDMNAQTKTWIKLVGLEKYTDQLVSGYSGGCLRRLAAACALCTGAPLTLLDEPTAGVDVAARRRVWYALKRGLRDQHAIIITSHSLDEMEALCHRIAIMVAGQLCALGSPAALKAAFAVGHSVILKIKHESDESAGSQVDQLKAFMQQKFNCTLKDEHKTMLNYHINETMEYSRLFQDMEQVQSTFPSLIEDYSVSETTLEEVFLSFAKRQEEMTKVQGKNKATSEKEGKAETKNNAPDTKKNDEGGPV
ncbi:ATP-binding cassette sub-family A member 3-like [Ostrinia furnacalis]|uniref:ATP-binding cassette sub-family A member 3-like n=1 Tax=Ostrinia furnacalis TaxID=93504 RepID=UPI00103A336D|nr:ATP-binding cassette sub-family A member 3-like [Ostrinia furnacalis]